MSHSLVEIPQSSWSKLRDLYAGNLDLPGFSCIHNFIHWAGENPTDEIKFLSLDGNWETDGTFLLVADIGYDFRIVLFNTLSGNFDRFQTAIKYLDTKCGNALLMYSDKFIPSVTELVVEHKSQIILYHINKDLVKSFNTQPPSGITVSSVRIEDAEQVDKFWPHRHDKSLKFVVKLITSNVSIGAYDDKGNLVAWCLRLPYGTLGLLQVVDSHQRLGLGSLVVRCISKKILEMGEDGVLAPVLFENKSSRQLFEKLGFQPITNFYFSYPK